MISYGRQDVTDEDIQQVIQVLESDYLTQGPVLPLFEESIQHYCHCQFAVAVNSATSALHLACLALGLGKGDRAWTSPISFVASANCALYCQADIDFVDIDENSWNMSVSALEEKLIQARKKNCLPHIVIAVHLAGSSCDMKAIYELGQEYGFKIIEDASHAMGAQYRNSPVGNLQYSDICIFSFHPVKIITTGEGGVATTNNHQLAEKMRLLRSHGITRDEKLMTRKLDDPWFYQQIDLGFNYRLTDIQAALGISQMKRLDQYITARHSIAQRYQSALTDLPLSFQQKHTESYSSFHLFIIRLNKEAEHLRRYLLSKMLDNDIKLNLHYIPIHLQPFYQNLGFTEGDFPQAEEYYHQALSLPIYPLLKTQEQQKVIDVFQEVLIT